MMKKKLLVFTDLDGTLMDHKNYSWQAATPAIERLQQLGFPLVFNTSKTLAELIPFAQELNNRHPLICENGNLISIPPGYFPLLKDDLILFGKPYKEIISILNELRDLHGFVFTGFHDLGVEGVMEQTGLDRNKAKQACERLCSEPLLWLEDDSALADFYEALHKHGLNLTRGGRFYHVMTPVNKSTAMEWLLSQYQQQEPETEWITVGLGDSHNDIQMLEGADYPVLIRNPHTTPPELGHVLKLITPNAPGPAGWNEAVNQLIDDIIEE